MICLEKSGDQYDWTTPGDRTMEVNGGSTGSHPLRPCVFAYFIGLETKVFLDFKGRRGITSVVRWNLRLVIFGVASHWERKGRFRKRVGFGECTLVPVFVPGERANVPSFRFSFRGNIQTYPRSGFRSGQQPRKGGFSKGGF